MEKTWKNATDRGKVGVRRSVLIDGRGVPLGAAVDGANVLDQNCRRARSTIFRFHIRNPRRANRNISAWIKDTRVEPFEHELRRRHQRHVPLKDTNRPQWGCPHGKVRRWKVKLTFFGSIGRADC